VLSNEFLGLDKLGELHAGIRHECHRASLEREASFAAGLMDVNVRWWMIASIDLDSVSIFLDDRRHGTNVS